MPRLVDAFGQPVVVATLEAAAADGPDSLQTAASLAAAEALSHLPPGAGRTVAIAFVGAETGRPGWKLDPAELIAKLRKHLDPGHDYRPYLLAAGNAGAAEALKVLGVHLDRHPEAVGLVVAADSLTSRAGLAYLEAAARLKTRGSPRGAIPGEAAVALLVESSAATRDDRRPLCRICGVATAHETVPIGGSPLLGTGLTIALNDALAAAGWKPDRVDLLYSDINGEEYRSHELMLAMLRTMPDVSIVHPADCVGEIGAASLALLAGAAATALSQGYSAGDHIVACASSDLGLRGAVCLAHH
jgi:3-oxoacyl-[acyl-carrier-protein] synthase-1